MVGRVPVPGEVDRQLAVVEEFDAAVENGNHLVPFRDRQTAAGEEVDLHVHDDEGIAGTWCQVSSHHVSPPVGRGSLPF